ncbi:unnamed protein product, partial [Chrysoparadoxa australica]
RGEQWFDYVSFLTAMGIKISRTSGDSLRREVLAELGKMVQSCRSRRPAQRVFEAFDSEDRGYINRRQLQQGLREHLDIDIDDEDSLDQVMELFELDKRGRITMASFELTVTGSISA